MRRSPTRSFDFPRHLAQGASAGRRAIFGFAFSTVCLGLTPATAADVSADELEWSQLPELPLPVSGHFAGVVERPDSSPILVIAGGSDFPGAAPWDGGEKVWYRQLRWLALGDEIWQEGEEFARALAYGVTISENNRVVLVGGSDGQTHTRDVHALTWNHGALRRSVLSPLPGPCAFMAGTLLNGVCYVAGGQRTPAATQALGTFWSLDLSGNLSGEDAQWKSLESWPGPARILPIVASQDGAVLVASGARLFPADGGGVAREYLRDAYLYRPGAGWRRVADLPHALVAAPSVAAGSSHVLVFSGDDGENSTRLAELRERHPGFRREVLAYDTVTDTWRTLGGVPESLVTTNVVAIPPFGDESASLVVPGGEDRPGHRSPTVLRLRLKGREALFHALDYTALVIYLGALVVMGIYFARRGTTTDDFFLAGRRIPWWAATLSIFSTQLSAITFMAIPAKAFTSDWVSSLMNLGIILVSPLTVWFFLPLYRRLGVTTIYEYLELRFNAAVRLYGSISFIVYQLGRIGIVLLLPSLALSTVTGFDVYLCIGVMGLLCTLYTVLGGIEAVVWTDVLQSFVLLGGAVACVVVIVLGVDGGAAEVLRTANQYDKFRVAEWGGGLTSTVIWVVVLGGFFTQFVPYSSDQTLVQRFLTTPTEGDARRAVWLHAALVVPATILFFGLGTALFVFYRQQPELLPPVGESSDVILPWFIATRLPAGIAGLVIAALFAATMSSVDSSMNSVATSVVTDLYGKVRPDASDSVRLRLARKITIVTGVLATASAGGVALLGQQSLWDLFLKTAGLLGSGLAGVFVLGVFTQRAHAVGALVGVVASAVTLVFVQTAEGVHGYLFAAVGILTCVLFGYLASLVLPGERRSLDGLTVRTMPPPEGEGGGGH